MLAAIYGGFAVQTSDAGALGPKPVSVATFDSYYKSCASYQNNVIYHQYRAGTGALYTAARGEVILQPMHSCTNAANDFSQTFVNLANIQGNGNLAQCLYGNILGNGTNYWYTPQNDGRPSAFPNRPRIQTGDDVVCSVFAGSNNTWVYQIVNNTTGQTATATSPRSGSGGTEAWWGFEVYNNYDQLGGAGSTSRMDLIYPAYISPGGACNGAWCYATGDKVGYWAAPCPPCGGVQEPWWVGTSSTFGTYGYDRITGYTTTIP